MATLEQFLRIGEWGPIHLGMSQADVISEFGAPHDESFTDEPEILKYGGCQLSFANIASGQEQVLVLLGLYPAETIPESLRPVDFNVTSETTVTEIRDFLARLGINEVRSTDGSEILALSSGATISFVGDKLHSIQFALRSTSTARKQVSVSIPDEAYAQLKILAKESNRSVAQLCSQRIAQRAKELRAVNGKVVSS